MASIQQHNHPRSTDRLEYLSTWRLSRKAHHPHPTLSNQTLQEHSGPILPARKVRAAAAAVAVSEVVAAVSHKRQQAMARRLPPHTRWMMLLMLSYICKCFLTSFHSCIFHLLYLSFFLFPPHFRSLLSIISHSSCNEWKNYHLVYTEIYSNSMLMMFLSYTYIIIGHLRAMPLRSNGHRPRWTLQILPALLWLRPLMQQWLRMQRQDLASTRLIKLHCTRSMVVLLLLHRRPPLVFLMHSQMTEPMN